jgi:hypothetical protein
MIAGHLAGQPLGIGLVPLDEERPGPPVGLPAGHEQAPRQRAAIRTQPLHRERSDGIQPGGLEASGVRLDVGRRQRVADQAARVPAQERRQRPAAGAFGLHLIVNRDDLQVVQAEPHDGVVRPPTGVPTAGAHVETHVVAIPPDGRVQVVHGDDEMVEALDHDLSRPSSVARRR